MNRVLSVQIRGFFPYLPPHTKKPHAPGSGNAWNVAWLVLWLLAANLIPQLSTTARLLAGESTANALPVLELGFEDNVTDASSVKHTCTPHGTISFVEGRHGKCVALDGRSWIDTGLGQKELGDEFTVECWVKPAAQQNGYADIFGNHVSEAKGFVLQQDSGNTNQFVAGYGAGSNKWVLAPAAPLAADRWQHVAMVKTKEGISLFVNGVQVSAQEDAAQIQLSPMPVAVGLGYAAEERCFRGFIDEFRIWNKAMTAFGHAGIDPAAARETRSMNLDSVPRPVAGATARTWTLATDDTRLILGLTASDELVVRELTCAATGKNWIGNAVVSPLPSQVEISGQQRTPHWRLADSAIEDCEGKKLTLRFTCDDPALEFVSQWHARTGPGPIHHDMRIKNLSTTEVTIGEHPTFDLDVAGAAVLWSIHTDGGTPDSVGVYRRPLADVQAGSRYSIRTAPSGEFIPLMVLESADQQGIYFGLEWSVCRIETVTLAGGAPSALRVRAGNVADLRMNLAPGETCELRPGFLGAYRGDIDDMGNRLRRWLRRYCVPEILRQDAGYPRVQWNAFGAVGKTPGSWDPVEKKYYPLIDDIAPLGFEEVMIDVGWWEGNEPDSDSADWSSGMKKAADYAHAKGMRFGLYWTDNLDMADPAGRRQRADRISRLFRDYHADMWRSDNTRGELIGASFAATRGFYEMVDELARNIPGFQWENCCSGGRVKDFGAMRRAVKIFNSDTYSTLHARQAFHDTSYVYPPVQIEGHLGSTDGRFRPRGVAGLKFAFRSTSMGAPEWFLDAPNGGNGSDPWDEAEKNAVKSCVETYKTTLRPLVRTADVYHIFPRPDGKNWDGVEYYDPDSGRGAAYIFKPSPIQSTETVRFKGLESGRKYRLTFEDGTQPASVRTGDELMNQGLPVMLAGDEASELVFIEFAQ